MHEKGMGSVIYEIKTKCEKLLAEERLISLNINYHISLD
jgi:hypothetical protein